jgi:septal ring factor EnvC (AmiA/AmiB activator)
MRKKTKYEILEDKIKRLEKKIIQTKIDLQCHKNDIEYLKNRVTDVEYEDSDFIITMKKVEKSLNDNSRKHLLELITAFQVYQKYL